eukprot:6184574-Pleurochrysis_carterae.AAC.4
MHYYQRNEACLKSKLKGPFICALIELGSSCISMCVHWLGDRKIEHTNLLPTYHAPIFTLSKPV